MAYYNDRPPPYAMQPSISNCNWYDGSSSNSGMFHSEETIREPLQLVPNAYNGLPYPQQVHMHPPPPSASEFPNQVSDMSAFHGTSMPNDKMQNSNFYGATSSDANVKTENNQALAEPLNGYAPCQGPRPWNFAQCYGFYGEPACPLVNIIDIEDFM